MTNRWLSLLFLGLGSLLVSNSVFAGPKHKVFSFIPMDKGWHCHAVGWYSSSSSTSSPSCKYIFWIVKDDQNKLNQFVDQNYARLQEEASKGDGAVLNDYVSLMGCNAPTQSMQKALQRNYQQVFSGGKESVVQKTTQMIEVDSELATVCNVAG